MSSPINYQSYFARYIAQAEGKTASDALAAQDENLSKFLSAVDEEKSKFSYAEGKWTLRVMLQHLIDAERIFAYRALCIARGEQQRLNGFDEDEYADASNGNSRLWAALSEEMLAVRATTRMLFDSFTQEMLHREGLFSSGGAIVRDIGLIVAGHANHHIKVAVERYGVTL